MSEPITKDQCEFFRSLYEEEERTSLQLEGRAKVYLGVISAFLAVVILKAADAKAVAEALHVRWGLLLSEALPMTVALGLILWALRPRHFEAANDGPKLISLYVKDGWPDEEQFFEDRVADYASSSSINRQLNNETTVLLEWASRCIAIGVIYIVGIVLYAIWRA